jgi:hypothetical protein
MQWDREEIRERASHMRPENRETDDCRALFCQWVDVEIYKRTSQRASTTPTLTTTTLMTLCLTTLLTPFDV